MQKQLELVNLLFVNGASLSDNTKHKELLFFAAENNMITLLEEIIKRGISASELDHNGNSILMIAYKNKLYSQMMNLIKEYNLYSIIVLPNKNGETLLIQSIKEGNKELAKYFIQNISSVQNNPDKVRSLSIVRQNAPYLRSRKRVLWNSGVAAWKKVRYQLGRQNGPIRFDLGCQKRSPADSGVSPEIRGPAQRALERPVRPHREELLEGLKNKETYKWLHDDHKPAVDFASEGTGRGGVQE